MSAGSFSTSPRADIRLLAVLWAASASSGCYDFECGPGGLCPAQPAETNAEQPCEAPVALASGESCPAGDAMASQLRVDEGSCLALSPAMRSGLVLWLDPTLIAGAEDDIRTWCDRSGRQNHASPALLQPPLHLRRDALPLPQRYVVMDGNWLRLPHLDTSLLLDDTAFTLFVGASVPRRVDLTGGAPAAPVTLFHSIQPTDVQLTIEPDGGGIARLTLVPDGDAAGAVELSSAGSSLALYDAQPHLYTLRQSSGSVELHVDGQLVASGVLPAGTSLAPQPELAATGLGPPPLLDAAEPSDARGQLATVVAFKGELGPGALGRLHEFLCAAFALCEP